MAAMLEMCPAGDEKSKIFPAFFLQRLPAQLRLLLTKDNLNDLVGLAEHADELWSHHQQEGTIAAVAQLAVEDEQLVVAIGGRDMPPSGQGSKYCGSLTVATGGGEKAKSKGPPEPVISRQARLAAGLCLAHWRYGKAAHACTQPCTWAEN
jgi:hypothetical protein